MCRNIRVLHHFQPPTTPDEIRAAALQYVRKVAGIAKTPKGEADAVERAVEAVAEATAKLLATLPERGAPRTRENEKLRAKARWQSRETRIRTKAVASG
jgi:hypothetical protein